MIWPHTVTIYRETKTTEGPHTDTTMTLVGTSRAFIQERTARKYTEGREYVGKPAFCFFPYGTDVVEGDQVIWGSRTYKVLSVGDPSGMEHHLEADLEAAT